MFNTICVNYHPITLLPTSLHKLLTKFLPLFYLFKKGWGHYLEDLQGFNTAQSVFGRNGEMKLREAWFTKGLISGGFICSQYHLVAKECKTSRYITDRGGLSRGQKVKVLPYFYSTHELSSWYHQRRNQVIPFKSQTSLESNPKSSKS